MPIGLLVIRLAIGLTFAAHGAQKFGAFGGRGLGATAAFFESIGFRPGRRHAEMAAVTEIVAGLMLAVGVLTPLAAAALIAIMVVAAVTARAGHGFFSGRGGYEYEVVLAAVAAGIAFTGPGALSLDWVLDLDVGGPLWGALAVTLGVGGAVAQLGGRQFHRNVLDLRGRQRIAGEQLRR